jgi:hypothetical protein
MLSVSIKEITSEATGSNVKGCWEEYLGIDRSIRREAYYPGASPSAEFSCDQCINKIIAFSDLALQIQPSLSMQNPSQKD